MSSTEPLLLMSGAGPRAWHCAALHRLGMALVHLARRLDALSLRELPWEEVRTRLVARDEHFLDLRHRIYTRYY